MPTFQYTARDQQQAEQSGHIDAVDSQAARTALEASGLTVLTVTAETNGPLPRLSTTEALELTTQIAEIVKAGLPLAAGLRAMQADLPRGRLAKAVGMLAEGVEAGQPVDVALSAAASRLPAHFRGLLAAGVRGGRLAEVLQESLEYEQLKAETGRRLAAVMNYPLLVLGMLAAWSIFVFCVLIPPMAATFDDFDIEIPPVTEALIWLSGPGIWWLVGPLLALIIVPIGLRLLASTFLGSWFLARLPLFGKMWRSRNLVGFCNLLSTLIEQSVPLPAALELTADGLGDGELRAASRRAAEHTAAGERLSESVTGVAAFPRTLGPIVHWGEQLSAQSEALRSAGSMYRSRMETQIELLAMVFPPLTFIIVAGTVWLLLGAMFYPLLRLVTTFS